MQILIGNYIKKIYPTWDGTIELLVGMLVQVHDIREDWNDSGYC